MGIEKVVIDTFTVEHIFPDIREKAVYVKLADEDQATNIKEYSTNLRGEARCLDYVHPPFSSRYRAIHKLAYDIRKESNHAFKTMVWIGKEDFALYKRSRNSGVFQQVPLPSSLPPVRDEDIQNYEITWYSRWSLSGRASRHTTGDGSTGSNEPLIPLKDYHNTTTEHHLLNASTSEDSEAAHHHPEDHPQESGNYNNLHSEVAQNEERKKTTNSVPEANLQVSGLRTESEYAANLVKVKFNGQAVSMMCDSGSQATTLPLYLYNKYKSCLGRLERTGTKILPYGSSASLTVVGKISGVVFKNKLGRSAAETIYIVKTCEGTSPVLSNSISKELGFLKFNSDGAPPEAPTNKHDIQVLNEAIESIRNMFTQEYFPSVSDFGQAMAKCLKRKAVEENKSFGSFKHPKRNYGTQGLGARYQHQHSKTIYSIRINTFLLLRRKEECECQQSTVRHLNNY